LKFQWCELGVHVRIVVTTCNCAAEKIILYIKLRYSKSFHYQKALTKKAFTTQNCATQKNLKKNTGFWLKLAAEGFSEYFRAT